jgi:hypothetical protein
LAALPDAVLPDVVVLVAAAAAAAWASATWKAARSTASSESFTAGPTIPITASTASSTVGDGRAAADADEGAGLVFCGAVAIAIGRTLARNLAAGVWGEYISSTAQRNGSTAFARSVSFPM